MILSSPSAARRSACIAIVSAGLILARNVSAAPWQVSSGDARTSLVELYTSEGCSSCPPADRWLAGLADDAGLWVRVVPVAFHVTYWDGLGWRDRFADAAFDRRQRQVAERAGSIVYTPGVFVDGREWRRWRRGGTVSATDPAGVLQAALEHGTLRVGFSPRRPHRHLRVNVAWLLGPQETAVERGENRGRRLRHAFVVHELSSVEMMPGADRWRAEVAVDEQVHARSRALALWVEDERGLPLQATGGWL